MLLALLATFAAFGQGVWPQGVGDPVVVRVETRDPARIRQLQAEHDIWGYRWRDGVLVFATDRSRVPPDAEIDFAETALLRGEIIRPRGNAGIPGFSCYRTVNETTQALTDLETAHPDLVTIESYGESWEKTAGLGGDDLRALVITNRNVPGPKPVFMIMATMHPRELTTAESALRFGEWLLEGYETDADRRWLVDHVETQILAQHNPDGRRLVESGASFWRKNTNDDYCTSNPDSRGTDLNRNADTVFWGGSASSGNECSFSYRGPTAASEPETQAIEARVAAQFPDFRDGDVLIGADEDVMGVFISLHSFGEFVFYPWEGEDIDTGDEPGYQALTQRMAFLADYASCQNCCLGTVGGTSVDQVYEAVGVASLTVELGTTFGQSCASFESQIWHEAREMFFYAAKAARRPYTSSFGPRVTDMTATANEDGSVTITALASDADYIVNHACDFRIDPVIMPEIVAAASLTIDQPPWLADETFAMEPEDGAFDEAVEVVTATLPPGTLPVGVRHSIFVSATDGGDQSGPPSAVFATAQIDINDPPTAVDDSGISVDEGGEVMITAQTLKQNDTDAEDGTPPGGDIALAGTETNGTAVLNGQTVTFTHDGTQTGTASFQYTVMDSDGASSGIATVTLTVNNENDPPVGVVDSGFAAAEGGEVMITATTLTANDTDEEDGTPPGGDIALTGSPVNGSAVLNGQTVTFTHDGSETGTASFQYTVMDSGGATSGATTVTIGVTNSNDDPVAVDDTGISVDEGGAVMITAATLKANDTDEEDGIPPAGNIALAGITSNGAAVLDAQTVTFTHDGTESDTATLQYVVQDNDGAISGIATVTLTVNDVNDTPVAVDDSGISVDEGGAVMITAATLKANDTDEEDGMPPAGNIALAGITSNGTAVLNGQTVTFTHDGSESDTATFQYTVQDNDGATSGIATVTLTVNDINDMPVAVDDSGIAVDEDGEVMITAAVLKGNDTDEEDGTPPGGAIALGGTQTNGAAVLNGQTVTFAHDGTETTTASFQYTVTDNDGASSGLATVTLTVNPVNDPPLTADDSATTASGADVLIAVLDNDLDADDEIDPTTVTVVTAPANGTAEPATGGQIRYTPNAGFSGTDSFGYTVDDTRGATSLEALVTVTVDEVPSERTPATCGPLGNRVVVDQLVAIDTSGRFRGAIGGFAATGLPASLSIDAAGVISGTPEALEVADSPYDVLIEADDGGAGQSLALRITVDPNLETIFYSSTESFCILP